MDIEIGREVVEAARGGGLVVLAGAGASAGWPAGLPSWNPLNAAIGRALSDRLDAVIQSPEWSGSMVRAVDETRAGGFFPPDYQAQILEEVTGLRYFEGLASLDVDERAVTRAHDGIAALAAAAALRAVVTTNFDRLIEHALAAREVAHRSAFDDSGYEAAAASLRAAETGPIWVIKVHGCVSMPSTLIDTLKQRQRGRSAAVRACMERRGGGSSRCRILTELKRADVQGAILSMGAGRRRAMRRHRGTGGPDKRPAGLTTRLHERV